MALSYSLRAPVRYRERMQSSIKIKTVAIAAPSEYESAWVDCFVWMKYGSATGATQSQYDDALFELRKFTQVSSSPQVSGQGPRILDHTCFALYEDLNDFEKGFVDATLFLRFGPELAPTLIQFEDALNQLRVHVVYGRPELPPVAPGAVLTEFSTGFVEAVLSFKQRVVQRPTADEFKSALDVLEHYLASYRPERQVSTARVTPG
jgi:hypothetical protein